ncbi:hypothetical protein SAMN05421785_1252 [Chryseobacterium gambrini]|uniref:Uncharacterized protein n=1 Tax=Chryseobacterium gambrini TaxID=373672 RepID=A0A1N7QZ08_9FLAO|nr:hypothetical protein SAMN05421785_1252 [Chryseobacterium gambrini]
MKNDILFSLKDNLIKLATQFTKSKIFKIGTRFAKNRDQYEHIMKVNVLSYTAILILFTSFLRGLFLWHLDCLLFLLIIAINNSKKRKAPFETAEKNINPKI